MTSENIAPETRVSNWGVATCTQPAKRAVRRVMVVSKRSDQRLLETVLNAADYDVVFVEPPAHAYSQIKRIVPNLVIVCLEIDDVDGFQVLSMLKLDGSTCGIPLLTYTPTGEPCRFEEKSAITSWASA